MKLIGVCVKMVNVNQYKPYGINKNVFTAYVFQVEAISKSGSSLKLITVVSSYGFGTNHANIGLANIFNCL